MLKAEIREKLLECGFVIEELAGLNKGKLMELYNGHLNSHIDEILSFSGKLIISKKQNYYLLEDGSTATFEEVGIPSGYNSPFYHAGDRLP
jgi:hypothetical protein